MKKILLLICFIVPLLASAQLTPHINTTVNQFQFQTKGNTKAYVDSNAVFQVGGAVNDVKLDSVYGFLLEGSATNWDDALPASVTIGSGATAPSFTSFNGNLFAYEFVGTGATAKQLNMGFELYHSYKEGSTIYPHIHVYIPDNATGGTIKFFMEYTWTNIGSTGAVATTTISGTIVRTANQGIANNAILSFTPITGVGLTISSIVMCRIYRDPADAADTFGASVWLKAAGIHYESNTLGSRTITTK